MNTTKILQSRGAVRLGVRFGFIGDNGPTVKSALVFTTAYILFFFFLSC